jgi:hypothetical protein
VSSIGARHSSVPEVGVATQNGKSYYNIALLLNKIRIPFVDVLFADSSSLNSANRILSDKSQPPNIKLIITTRKERLLFDDEKVLCLEDIGSDPAIAKQKILAELQPSNSTDHFVVGVDPGMRTGIAAFMNHIEIESTVVGSLDETVTRVEKLIDNASATKKTVKIGAGMPSFARKLATTLESHYRGRGDLRIQLVDERGTSTLNSRSKRHRGTRDQRAAKIIAFRDGRDY